MAYTPHTLVTFGGGLTEVSGTDEIWECGVRGWNPVGGTPVDQAQLQNLIDGIAARPTVNLSAWFTALHSHHSTITTLAWAKAVNIGADGKYIDTPAIHEFSPAVAGGRPQGIVSYNSICYSWTTGTSFGKAQRGRIYPPNIGVDIAAGATISTATQTDLVAAALDLINVLSATAPEYQFEPGVFSKSGPHHKITGVRIGNVIDVQRRRRNAVAESYIAGTNPD